MSKIVNQILWLFAACLFAAVFFLGGISYTIKNQEVLNQYGGESYVHLFGHEWVYR